MSVVVFPLHRNACLPAQQQIRRQTIKSLSFSDDLLVGLGQIAAYYYGSDTPKLRRRISALLHEVEPSRRLPYYLDGGRPASRKSWLDAFTRSQAENAANLPPAA
jgi:hypothetical protein